MKNVLLDRTGRCLFHKRLHRGTFAQLPPFAPDEQHIELDAAALDDLLHGVTIQPQETQQKRTIRGRFADDFVRRASGKFVLVAA